MKTFGAMLVAGCAVLLAALIVLPAVEGPSLARSVGNAFLGEGDPGRWAGGEMEVSLWPRPTVTFENARFGAADAPWLRAGRFEARVAFHRLLLGRIAFDEVRITDAELRLDAAGAPAGLPRALHRAREVRMDGARVRVARAAPPLEFAHLRVRRLEGDSLHLEAETPAAEPPLAFEGVLGPGERDGPPRLRATFTRGGSRWDYAGTVDLAALAGGGRPLGEGKIGLESADAGGPSPDAPAVPLAAEGNVTFHAGPAGIGAGVTELALRWGGLKMLGALDLEPGPRPRIGLALAARRADAPALGPETLRAFAETAAAGLRGVDADVLLEVEALRAGDELVRDVSVRLAAEDGRVRVERLDARLPGGAGLELAGDADGAPEGALFHGRASLATRDLRALAGWLGRDLDGFRPDRLRSFEAQGTLTLLEDGWRVADATGTLDSEPFRGALARPSGPEARIDLALALPRLDPGAFVRGSGGGTEAMAGALALLGLLPEGGADVELSVAELELGETLLAGVAARGGTDAGSATLRRLRIDDFAGAAFEMEGAVPLSPAGGPAEARIAMTAGDVRALADALGIGDALPALPPGGAEGTLEIRGGPARFDVVLEGNASGGRLAAEGTVDDLLGETSVDLDVRIEGTAAPGGGNGFAVAGRVAGAAGKFGLHDVRLAAAGVEGAAEGTLSLDGRRPRLEADLDLRRLALPLPPAPRPDGPAWARLGLPVPLLAGVDADLRIRADAVDLGGGRTAGDARGTLALRADGASFRDVRAHLGGGWVRAEGTFRTGPVPAADLELRLSNAEVGEIRAGAGFAIGDAHVSGVLRLHADGVTGPAMAQTLAGAGWLAFREGAVSGLGAAVGVADAPLALHRARGEFSVRDGIFFLEEGTAEIGDWRGGLAGEVSVVDRTADVRLLLRPREEPEGELSVVRVRGPWRELRGRLAAAGGPGG